MSQVVHASLETPALELFAAVGIVADRRATPPSLELFAEQSDRALARTRAQVEAGDMPRDKAAAFQQLIVDACAHVMCHPVIAGNRYLERFAQGVSLAQARHELQQFSVFALQFDVAQAKLVANAPTWESYKERLKVLLNEKGIPYTDGFDGDLTGKWSPATVHFHWLMNTAKGLGLGFEDLGKIWIGQGGTQQFVKCTFDTYASTDRNTALGASFAIENWAANGLWTPWIAGMKKLNATLDRPVDLGYLTYHEAQEEHHSQATIDELYETFLLPEFDHDTFFAGADRILNDGVQAYYESQLATLPEKDATWPESATRTRMFDPADLPRLELAAV
ncbi:MAG: hypothetical protein RIC55_34120 [Pirellulaceae bacterium]